MGLGIGFAGDLDLGFFDVLFGPYLRWRIFEGPSSRFARGNWAGVKPFQVGIGLVGHGRCSLNRMVENLQEFARARLVNSLFPTGLLLVVDSLRAVGLAVGVVVANGGINYQSIAPCGCDRSDAGLAVVYAIGVVPGFGF